jgi:hypothetical protein
MQQSSTDDLELACINFITDITFKLKNFFNKNWSDFFSCMDAQYFKKEHPGKNKIMKMGHVELLY